MSLNFNFAQASERLKLRLEKKGLEYVKARSLVIKSELEDLGKRWLQESRRLLSVTATPNKRVSGDMPRTYKWLPKDSYSTNKVNPIIFLVDTLFVSVRRRVNTKSVTLSLTRGFYGNETMAYNDTGTYDYADVLNEGKYKGFKERITDTLDTRVNSLLLKRSFK